MTFFTESDAPQLRAIANVMRGAGCHVPAWMLTLEKTRKGHYNGKAGIASHHHHHHHQQQQQQQHRGSSRRGGTDDVMYGSSIRARRPGQKKRKERSETEAEKEKEKERAKEREREREREKERDGRGRAEEHQTGIIKLAKRPPKRIRELERAQKATRP